MAPDSLIHLYENVFKLWSPDKTSEPINAHGENTRKMKNNNKKPSHIFTVSSVVPLSDVSTRVAILTRIESELLPLTQEPYL